MGQTIIFQPFVGTMILTMVVWAWRSGVAELSATQQLHLVAPVAATIWLHNIKNRIVH